MNEYQIRKFIDIIHPNNDLFEIRVIDGKRVSSAYFKDSKLAYEAIKGVKSGNIYIVFNNIKDACYGRQQRDELTMYSKNTTSDGDIVGYEWILLDIDPVRPSDCNSSELELNLAREVIGKIGTYLKHAGFANPVYGMSGNGYHFLYKVKIENTADNQATIKNFLNAMSMLFSDDKISVDTSVFSPAQLTKLMGTLSRKGTSKDTERPQRLSQLIHVPEVIGVNDISLVKKIADLIPQPEKSTYHNNYSNQSFNLDDFVSKNGILVSKDYNSNGIRKLILTECPFDKSHKAPDSSLFQLQNGAVGFKCLHNSCNHYTWKDVRAIYEPNAYSRFDATRTTRPSEYIVPEIKEIGAKFLQMHEIKYVDRSQIVTMPTGFTSLDKRIIGLNKNEISLMSGSSGSGKSTLINQIALNAANKGFKISIWSGELTASRMKHWVHLQCAGRQYTLPSTFSENSFYIKESTAQLIDTWLKDRFFIYNNNYGNKFTQLLADIEAHVKEKKVDLVVLDNLMALDILMLEGDKNQQQTKMIIELVNMTKRLNIHLLLVAHPRKVVSFLRKNDISGSADLANAVDNVFIVHRVNNDFVKTSCEFYGTEEASKYYSFSNVIEVCKNRDLGIQDEMFGLFFEIESKRFLNERFESNQYGWVELLRSPNLTDKYFEQINN